MPRKAESGQGWPVCAGPRSGTGAREVWPRSGQTRMSGHAFSLVTFSLRGQRESDSAGGRNPEFSNRWAISPAPGACFARRCRTWRCGGGLGAVQAPRGCPSRWALQPNLRLRQGERPRTGCRRRSQGSIGDIFQATRWPYPLQEAARRCCAGGERQGCRESQGWAREGPSLTAPGAAPE